MIKLRFLNRGSRITDATQPPPGLPPPPSQQNNIQSQYTFATDQQKFIRPINPILNPDASHGSPGSFNSMPNLISENLYTDSLEAPDLSQSQHFAGNNPEGSFSLDMQQMSDNMLEGFLHNDRQQMSENLAGGGSQFPIP